MSQSAQRAPGAFPPTRHSVVVALRDANPAVKRDAFETLIGAYWKPVYKYLRVKWQTSPEDSEDLTQAFFARALEKGYFDRYDAAQARFRTYLRTCLDGFVANERKSGARLKRGGAFTFVPLDFLTAEGELRRHDVADATSLDEYFHREWVRSLFASAVDSLRARFATAGNERQFDLFERYDLDRSDAAGKLTYAQLAYELGLTVNEVTNTLATLRREFRRLVLERLRESCGSEAEFREEAHHLLGVEPR